MKKDMKTMTIISCNEKNIRNHYKDTDVIIDKIKCHGKNIVTGNRRYTVYYHKRIKKN